MASSSICRLCQTASAANSVVAIFSLKARETRMAHRISQLLDISVCSNDGLPGCICMKCSRRIETLERSAENLKKFKILAQDSYTTLSSRGPNKRTKDTSTELNVSPDIERARPLPKRPLSQRQLNFEEQSIPFQQSTDPVVNSCITTSQSSTVTDIHKDCLSLSDVPKAILQNKQLQDIVWNHFLHMMDQECSSLCKRSGSLSPFRTIAVDKYSDFNWQYCIEDLSTRAPLLLSLLTSIVSHNDYRNVAKCKSAHNPGICMAAAILLKERNREMTGLQSLLSLILYSSHVEKQVYTRLNHVNICASYSATLAIMDSISSFHTQPLERWIAKNDVIKYWGDNVDKKRGVRDVRSDRQGQILHMYSIIAGQSRTPAMHLRSTGIVGNLSLMPACDFLPSQKDIKATQSDLVVLVSRIITEFIKDLAPFHKIVPQHITHRYSKNMADKSNVVLVDVLMKNETKHSDMIDIMTAMHSYLGKDYPSDRRLLSGGDLLTCERQIGSQRHLMDGDTIKERLGVLEPVTEDWHCLVCLLTVVWKTLYGRSSRDHGTLGYFRTILKRTSVKTDVKKAVDPNLEFLSTVVKGHILAAACKVIGIADVESKVLLPQGILKASAQIRLGFIYTIAEKVVKECTLIDFCSHIVETDDHVYNYARVLCHYGALILNFQDACNEGDGERVFRCWRLLLPHFKAEGRTKYSLEALRLQIQVKSLLSPHLAHQVIWNRFVNTKGGMGNNIQMDLYNEHMVKIIKKIVTNMGPNLTEKALQRAARSVTTLESVCAQYDKETTVSPVTTAHSTVSNEVDVKKVTNAVLSKKILEIVPGRAHTAYKKIKLNPLWKWDRADTLEWITKKKTEFVKFNGAALPDEEPGSTENELDDEQCSSEDDDDE